MISADVIQNVWEDPASELPWRLIPHFYPYEFAGHIDEISGAIVLALEAFREDLKHPVYVSPATWGTHSKKSWHYGLKGRNKYAQALDVFPKCDLRLAWMRALKCGFFSGIGVYPFWKFQSRDIKGGLHLDLRRSARTAMWWQDKKGKYRYLNSTSEIVKFLTVMAGL